MTIEQTALLEKYGITTDQKTIYMYKGFRYDHLKDAVNYAEIDTKKEKAANK